MNKEQQNNTNNTTAPASTAQDTNTQKGNTTMENNTITATIKFISLPQPLNKNAYTNYHYYISNNNQLLRSPEKLPETNRYGKNPIRRDTKGNIIYKESNLIQILWTTPEEQLFITTYKPKETVKETITHKGSYGTTYTETYTTLNDYLRDYLIKPALTQLPLNPDLSNAKILETIIKEKLYITFRTVQEQNGQYLNTRYYPIHINADNPTDTPPEDNPLETNG